MSFTRCYVINLRRRPDRLFRFFRRLALCDWPFVPPIIFDAIDGDKVGVPDEFTEGGGAYGCRMSHLAILQQCLMEDIPSVFVLEDDADLPAHFGEKARRFLAAVPPDWTGLMFGGQHHASPLPLRPGIVRVQYAQRTHAYACRGVYMRELQRRWGNATVHIDWRMENWQHKHVVYAPEPWLVGQFGGRSDIRGAEKAAEWWQSGRPGEVPTVLLHAPRAVLEELRDFGWHNGFYRDAETGIDKGLQECYLQAKTDRELREGLRRWYGTLQEECHNSGAVCVIWHPFIRLHDVREALGAPLVEIHAASADEAVWQLPAAWRERLDEFAQRNVLPIVLLRTRRITMDHLRNQGGWYFGKRLDSRTGVDLDIDRALQAPPEARKSQLKRWVLQAAETVRHEGQIIAIWHERLSRADLASAVRYPVVELSGETADACRDNLRTIASTVP